MINAQGQEDNSHCQIEGTGNDKGKLYFIKCVHSQPYLF
jgi:hypothetical protein